MKRVRQRKPEEKIMAFDYLKFANGRDTFLPKGNSGWIGQFVEVALGSAPPGMPSSVLTEVWESDQSCEPQDTHITPSSEDRGYYGRQ